MREKRILITGGAGFIGSHLAEHLLLDKDARLLVIDDLSEGKLSNLPKNNRLTVIQSSIMADKIGKYFKNVDVVFHLAAFTRPRWSIDYPIETNRLNVEGTLKVMKYCLSESIGKLIYVSSASVYGKQNKLLLKESMHLRPMSPYALTKKIGEEYCRLYSELYGLKYDIVRPFNVYGKRQDLYGGYSAAVPNFIDMLGKGKRPYITGDGTQKRDFVYVKDVVRLMALVSRRKESGETFNAGSGKSTSVNELYGTISRLMKKSQRPEYINPVIDPETKADMSKAKRILNWALEYSLEDGLKETISLP